MSGIAGIVDFKGDVRRYGDVLDEMRRRLARRGPDEDGGYFAERVCLLHTRLVVIDAEGGKQPMVEKIGQDEMVITYNGELYNTQQLRDELSQRGHHFRGRSSAEVLLRAYIEWGEGCLDRLNGIYAFAIWDAKHQRLFAARDRMGVKPFFYSLAEGQLVFASEIKALLAHPLIKAEVDSRGVAELLLLGPGRTPGGCAFRQIQELKPGCCATYSPEGGLCVRSYWELGARKHEHSFDETLEYVRCLVRDAIKGQTISDRAMGVFLSGGLDSSAIAALAGAKRTFSVDYEENERYFKANSFQPNSDNIYIKQMNDFLGVEHTAVTLGVDELVGALFEAVDARDLPGMADVDSSLLLFCCEVSKYASAVLSGEGADELFGGYPWYRNEDMLNREGFPWAGATDYRAGFIKKGLCEGVDAAEYVRQRYEETVTDAKMLEGDSPEEKRMRQMFRLNTDWFAQTLLDRKDRMSMYNGLEARVPFCDYRIAEYMYNVPWEYKNYLGREKGLLREALRGVLPDEVLWRKKSPYPKTHHPEYLKKVTELLEEVVLGGGAPIFDIVEKSALEGLLRGEGNDVPWYGQLMTRPQTIAYFLQMNYWMGKYGVTLV